MKSIYSFLLSYKNQNREAKSSASPPSSSFGISGSKAVLRHDKEHQFPKWGGNGVRCWLGLNAWRQTLAPQPACRCVCIQILLLQHVQLVSSQSLFPSLLLSLEKPQRWNLGGFAFSYLELKVYFAIYVPSQSGTFRASLCDFGNKNGLSLNYSSYIQQFIYLGQAEKLCPIYSHFSFSPKIDLQHPWSFIKSQIVFKHLSLHHA